MYIIINVQYIASQQPSATSEARLFLSLMTGKLLHQSGTKPSLALPHLHRAYALAMSDSIRNNPTLKTTRVAAIYQLASIKAKIAIKLLRVVYETYVPSESDTYLPSSGSSGLGIDQADWELLCMFDIDIIAKVRAERKVSSTCSSDTSNALDTDTTTDKVTDTVECHKSSVIIPTDTHAVQYLIIQLFDLLSHSFLKLKECRKLDIYEVLSVYRISDVIYTMSTFLTTVLTTTGITIHTHDLEVAPKEYIHTRQIDAHIPHNYDPTVICYTILYYAKKLSDELQLSTPPTSITNIHPSTLTNDLANDFAASPTLYRYGWTVGNAKTELRKLFNKRRPQVVGLWIIHASSNGYDKVCICYYLCSCNTYVIFICICVV